MSITNECLNDEQKSSAEILDGLFRELEEKSAKGELPAQSDLSTVLGNSLTSDDFHRRSSHKKRKSSKHKHSHKHRKRKRHRKSSQLSSDNSSDEWVPAEEQTFRMEVAQVAEHCNVQMPTIPSQNEAIDSAIKVDENVISTITDRSDFAVEQKDMNNLQMSNAEHDMVFKSDAMPLQRGLTNPEVSKFIEDTPDKSHQVARSLHVNNEQVLFLPRVTRLDKIAFQRKSTSDNQDVDKLNCSVNNAVSVRSPGVIQEKLSIAVTTSGVVNKECKTSSTIELKQERPLRNDKTMDKSPISNEHSLAHKQVTKLKSKITCSSIQKVSTKYDARPKKKTKPKKKTRAEKSGVSIDLKLHSKIKSRDKKGKLKKHSKSKTISSRSRIRSKSPSSRSSCSRSPSRRSHSKSPKSHHSESRSKRFKSTITRKSRSCSREKSKRCTTSSRRSWTRDRAKTIATILDEKIDKVKLLEIARKNAMMMMSEGKFPVPVSLNLEKPNQEKVIPVPFKAGGKSVEELTDFCKLLAKREKEEGELSADDLSNKPYRSSDEEDRGVPFVHHHPFKLKEQPNIIMNIRNAVQIPIKTPAEKAAEGSKLRIQFPVSSGTQHRKKEWVPVSPKKPLEVVKEKAIVAVVEEMTVFQPPPVEERDRINSWLSKNTVDIGAIVSQRLKAVRKLMDNPDDVEALNQMYKSQQEMQNWAQSKQLPGQFTGTTDVQILTPEQLAGPAHLQAWVKKDQFNRAAPVQGGFGMYMLQKMGWRPGEGLGKNKEGTAEPIILDIKTDKKGLVSQGEIARKNAPVAKDLSGKHPVSALVELCNKRRWLPPEFILVHDSGPDHKKNFVFKVRVNGQEFQPTIASLNKKHAKAQSATVCLQSLGLVPRDLNKPL